MSSIPNLANQLNLLSQSDGLGKLFFAMLLKNASPEQLIVLANSVRGETQMHATMIQSIKTLALEKSTSAPKK